MKILFWNCNGAFRRKVNIVQKYNADVYIIAECENPKLYNISIFNYKNFWIGNKKFKGLAVFVNPKFSVELLNWLNDSLEYYFPIKVDNQVIVAVWAKSPYIEGYFKWQELNFDKIDNNVVIIGDFNSNAIWDKEHGIYNHTNVVNQLKNKNIVSVYHFLSGEQHGSENKNTFFMYRNITKGYHIDYAFCAKEKIKNFCIENSDMFIKFSDHVPIILDINN